MPTQPNQNNTARKDQDYNKSSSSMNDQSRKDQTKDSNQASKGQTNKTQY